MPLTSHRSATAVCFRLLAVLAGALLGLSIAYAQPPPMAAPAALDKAARAAVVQAAAKALRDAYVYPEVGDKAAHTIEDALSAASYDALSEPAAFAARLSADLDSVAHDKHLRVFVPGAMQVADAALPPRSEACVVRSDRLPGNIGYVEVICLPGLGAFRAALDRALAPLSDTKALIIDSRRNHGGSPAAEAYLAGYLLPAGAQPVVFDRFVLRVAGTQTFNTQDFKSSPTPLSFAGKPVYVLNSHETFSGGEALAYGLQVRHMAHIVGEVSGGGANPGGGVPLAAGLGMNLPIGRSNNPVTHTNWEGVGVKPDIEVPASQALKTALQRLGQKPAAEDIDSLSQARVFTPRTVPQPGSEAAVRRIIAEHQSGHVDLSLYSEDLAQAPPEFLKQLHEMFVKLGAVEAVHFDEVDVMGDDVYEVKMTHGSVKFSIMLGADGKTVVSAGVQPLSPPPANPG